MKAVRLYIIITCVFMLSMVHAGQWTSSGFLDALDRLENTRGAFLPEEQVIQAARICEDRNNSLLKTIRAIQRPKNSMPAIFGKPTRAVSRQECIAYPAGSWSRQICLGALGLITEPPAEITEKHQQPRQVNTPDAPKYWPKANIPIKMPPKKAQPEPPFMPIPVNTKVYLMLCKERANLYWFTTDGRFGRVTRQNTFQMPRAMCKLSNGNILVLDQPVYTTGQTRLWNVNLDGRANPIAQWPANDKTIPIDRPSQMMVHRGIVYFTDQINGLISYDKQTGLRQIFKPSRSTRRYGGIAITPQGLLLFANGFNNQALGTIQTGMKLNRMTGRILAFNTGNRQTSVVATDSDTALWMPRALAWRPDGTLFLLDEGWREKTEKFYVNAHKRYNQIKEYNKVRGYETMAHADGTLFRVHQGRLVPVAVKIGNRSLKHPWGLAADTDGHLIIADPSMLDNSGQVNGAAVRYSPEGQTTYLFQNQKGFQPIWVLPN
jgi:hypothetical protein